MLIVVLAFILLILFGIPIAYVIGLTTTVYIFAFDNANLLTSVPHRMINGLQNYGLLAIPLFVLVGELMNSGGITSRLIHFARVLFGHFRGGLAYVNVVANMFLASIMGSTNAQTAMMSKVMVPEMEKEGYKKEFSASLTVSSALIGPIIPPSIIFIIYAVTAEVSIGQMFLAGVIPGILLGIAFIILISLISLKENFPVHERAPYKDMWRSFLKVFPALLIPVIIVFGILSGMFTATESAAIACFLAFISGKFIYRELKLKELPQLLINTAVNTSIVTFIIAMATIFGWVLSFERIPQTLAESMISITESPFVFLLICVILFLLIGMVLEGIAAIIILVPVLLPVAITYGIDPIQFGIIIAINLTIGLITPPVGTALFIASSITKVKLEVLARSTLPFLVAAIVILLIITYVPPITMWLPNLMR